MSRIKRHMEEIEARGYADSDKFVCAGCIRDSFITTKIRNSHNYGTCSFCRSKRNVLPMNDILSFIAPVVSRDFLSADGNAIWDSEEKRYLEPVTDTYDVVHDYLNEYLQIENDALLQEIVDKLPFEDKVSADVFRKRQEEKDMDQWDEYCQLVSDCPLTSEQIVGLISKRKFKGVHLTAELDAISGTLSMVYKYCKKMNLITILYGLSSQYYPASIYRCVDYLEKNPHFAELDFIPATLVGTAPAKNVSDNRMSEKGDMMFYGADDVQTALAEVGKNKNHPSYPATIGTFRPNKRFRVLNLTNIDKWKLPSIFDIEHEVERSTFFFLKEFMERISEEKKDSSDYKPTQVFTKYIQRNTDLQGIKYNSSRVREGNRGCYVLFVVNRDCLDNGDKTDSSRNQLVMGKVEQRNF